MRKIKKPILNAEKLEKVVIKKLKSYGLNDKSVPDLVGMFLGKVQIIEFYLKKILIDEYYYDESIIDNFTFGKVLTELRKTDFRKDFLKKLDDLRKSRNYVAHSLLTDYVITQKLFGDQSYSDRKFSKYLVDSLFLAEEVTIIFDFLISEKILRTGLKQDVTKVEPDYWFIHGRQYLIAADTLLDRIIKNKNQTSYFGEPLKDKTLIKKLDSNDVYLFFPLMLLFYHGIELFLKAVFIVKNGEMYGNNHKITLIMGKVEGDERFKIMLDEIKRYTSQLKITFPEFAEWIRVNNFKSIDDFYLFLKYPADGLKGGKIEIYDIGVLGNNLKTLPNYRHMKKTINSIIKEGVKIFRTYKGIV